MNKSGAIIIGGHAQGLGIIRALGKKGIPIILIDSQPLSLGMFSRYTEKVFTSPKVSQTRLFLNFLIRLSLKYNLKNWQLYPTDDRTLECLSINQKIIKKYFITNIISSADMKDILNKYRLYNRCKDIDIPQPWTFIPKNLNNLLEHSNDVSYPLHNKTCIDS